MASGPSAETTPRVTVAEISPPVSPKTIPASLNLARGWPNTSVPEQNDNNSLSTTSSRPLEVLLCSPRFPDGYHQPVWRIADALDRIKRLLKIGDDHHHGGSGMQTKGVMGSEFKAVWVQLEIIDDVLLMFMEDIDAAIPITGAVLQAEDSPEGKDNRRIQVLFELMNYDDMLKKMYHFPSYALIIYQTISFHLSDLKLHLSRCKVHASHPVFAPVSSPMLSSGAPIHSTTANIQPAELLEFLTKQTRTLQKLIQGGNSLLRLNNSIKDVHTRQSQKLQSDAMGNLYKQSKPTKQLLKNLSRALQVIRSIEFLPEDEGELSATIEEIRSRNDAFYRDLLPLIKKAKSHLHLIEELGLNKQMDINKDVALPFYMELVRYTRGTVDWSPLSKFANERGLGVGNGSSLEFFMHDSTRCASIGGLSTRRLSLSSGSMLKGGLREGFMEWMRKHNGEEGKGKQRGLKGMWTRWKEGGSRAPTPVVSASTNDASGAANDQKYGTLKHKHKSTNLSDSFFTFSISSPSSVQQNSTDSLGVPLSSAATTASNHTRSPYSGSRDEKEKGKRHELWISEDHRAVLDEWEEFAAMVNVQKCMCKTGWMVGGIQHLRGRETKTTAVGHVHRDMGVHHDDNELADELADE